MMEAINFTVSPYALFETLWALENQKNSEFYIDYHVTKEDDELVVFAIKVYNQTSEPSNKPMYDK